MKKHYRKIIYNTKKEKKHCRWREKMKRELKAGGWKWWNYFMVNSPLHEYKPKYNYKGHWADMYVKKKHIKNVENEMKLVCNEMMQWILIPQEMNMTAEILQNNY